MSDGFLFFIAGDFGKRLIDHDDIAGSVQQHQTFVTLCEDLCRQLKLVFPVEILQREIDARSQFRQQFAGSDIEGICFAGIQVQKTDDLAVFVERQTGDGMYLVLSGDFFPDRRAAKNVADRIVFIILDPYRLVFSQRCSDDTLCYRFVVLVDHIQYLGDDGGRCPFRSDRIYPVFLVD